MKLIQVGNRAVNPSHVAYAEWVDETTLRVHFAVPIPQEAGSMHPKAIVTGHLAADFGVAEAVQLWRELTGDNARR